MSFPKHYYLIDTDATVNYLDPTYKSTHEIAKKIGEGCFYYIPQFCIAEVFNVFARLHFAEKKITKDKYHELCEIFKDMVRKGKDFYPYDLHRYHILNCDDVYEIEHSTPKGENKKLSAFDILIIAMGLELQHIHGKDNITILSCDKRIVKIAGLIGIKAEIYK